MRIAPAGVINQLFRRDDATPCGYGSTIPHEKSADSTGVVRAERLHQTTEPSL
jgi:hypothetical protein